MNCGPEPVSTGSPVDLSVTNAVVTAMSDLGRCDAVDLDVCLADYVDPDALEALFAGGRNSETALTTTVGPYEVSVRSVGAETVVTVRDGERRSRRVVHR